MKRILGLLITMAGLLVLLGCDDLAIPLVHEVVIADGRAMMVCVGLPDIQRHGSTYTVRLLERSTDTFTDRHVDLRDVKEVLIVPMDERVCQIQTYGVK